LTEQSPPSMVWCRIHRRWERADDLIDFPCSDTFLDGYHELGLTPRKSPRYYAKSAPAQAEIDELLQRISELERENALLKEALGKTTKGKKDRKATRPPTIDL